MKTIIGNIIIAVILSITLVALTGVTPHLARKYQVCRSAQQTPNVQEMPDGSYNTMINNLLSTTGR